MFGNGLDINDAAPSSFSLDRKAKEKVNKYQLTTALFISRG